METTSLPVAELKQPLIDNALLPALISKEKSSGFANTSKFPGSIYANLPEPIKTLPLFFDESGRQRDIFFFSLLHVLSACMPNVSGLYFGKSLSPNIYGIVGGPSGTGKSAMEPALSIIEPIIKKFTKMKKESLEQYKAQLAFHKANKSIPKPEKPNPSQFIIPANSSAAGIIRLLENSPHALIAETEADTLGNILGQKNFGNWSDLLRKLYHHEPYRYFRKTDDEFIELINHKLSLLLTGTPQQLQNLLKSSESGLLSRIGFYVYDEKPSFINPFRMENKGMVDALAKYSTEVYSMFFELLKREKEIEFRFTPEQEQRFTHKFKPIVDDYYYMSGSDASSIAMRLGVIFFRVAMILTVLRGYKEDVLVCNDTDYESANRIVDILAEHAVVVLSTFPLEKENVPGINAELENIIKSIPTERFETRWLNEELSKKGISRRTVFRIITQLLAKRLIRKVGFGVYEKLN